jgi:hypothetical protein
MQVPGFRNHDVWLGDTLQSGGKVRCLANDGLLREVVAAAAIRSILPRQFGLGTPYAAPLLLPAFVRRGRFHLCTRVAFRSMKYLRANFPSRAGNGAPQSRQVTSRSAVCGPASILTI